MNDLPSEGTAVLGEMVRAYRRRPGLPQEELAEAAADWTVLSLDYRA